MCIKCVVRALGEVIGESQGPNEISVGLVSPQLREDFLAHKKAEALADLDIQQLVLNGRRSSILGATEEELAEKQEAIDNQTEANKAKFETDHTALWNRVHEELPELDHARNYSIDAETGEVTTRRRRSDEGDTPNV
ncbi:hypothetical protein [Paenibacillus sinopodophylli]|uniref:hypothetical protein n=1 Tax=Paenibacillus sinopodophylli TaxID=1837342 RepID=UPI00110CB4CF|nr:hypothetical protein [Paenibacillus sinopodophylli]